MSIAEIASFNGGYIDRDIKTVAFLNELKTMQSLVLKIGIDLNFLLLRGLYEKCKKQYPFHEALKIWEAIIQVRRETKWSW